MYGAAVKRSLKNKIYGCIIIAEDSAQEENIMSASVAIQVLPQADNEKDLLRIVDEVIAYIAGTGLRYEVCPFETTIEGESYDQLMDIVKECQHVAVKAGARKASAYVKVVYDPVGEVLTIDEKIGKYRS